jgi:PAS domain S-box-containing protein
MIFVYKPYSILFLAGFILSLILAIITWKRRPAPGATAFSLFIFATFAWSFFWILELGSAEINSKILWAKLEYLGTLSLAPFWVVFTYSLTGKKWKRPTIIAALTILPVITFGVICTNEWHSWFWTDIYYISQPLGRLAVFEHGFWWWISFAYQYILITYGVVLLWLFSVKKSSLQRKLVMTLTLGVVTPILINLIYIIGIPALKGLDFTPLSIALSSIVFVFAIFRFHFLDVSKVARNTLVEKVPEGILVLNPDGHVIDMNPAAEKMLQVDKLVATGCQLSQIWPALDNMRTVSSGDRHWELTATGSETQYDLDISLTCIYDERKAMVGQLLTLRDVTERNQMERAVLESEKRYSTLVEKSNDGVLLIQNGAYIFGNKAVCDITGYSLDNLMGKTLPYPLEAESGKLVVDRLQLLASKVEPVNNFEIKMKRQDGKLIDLELSVAAINYQGLPAQMVTMRDVTVRKQAKEELERAVKQLKELDKLKDNLLSTVSHELRTPLTSIKSFVEILLSYEEDRKTQKEFLGIIDEECDRLTRLINDFLDLSRIQAGSMQWKTVDLSIADVIKSAAVTSDALIRKAGLKLELELEPDLPLVRSDRDKLIQVVTNLLGNAVKFTPEGGKIIIGAWVDHREGSADQRWITVSIVDTGIGIAPEHHQRIFENFGQVGDVLKDRPKGTGLGLPICKKIVDNFGGKIWVESAAGKGTTFSFTVPAAAKTSTARPMMPVAPPTILAEGPELQKVRG